jgi:hypothetical protein
MFGEVADRALTQRILAECLAHRSTHTGPLDIGNYLLPRISVVPQSMALGTEEAVLKVLVLLPLFQEVSKHSVILEAAEVRNGMSSFRMD